MQILPVMEKTGRMLGLISEAHILQAWRVDPLQAVSEVMASCGLPEGEVVADWEGEWLLEAGELREWKWEARWERASGT